MINADLKKNKTFMSFKEEFDNLGNRCRHFIKEVTLSNEQLKNNFNTLVNQIEESRANERMSKTTAGDMSRKR
jgi:Na+-transporting NADH:ubiquinone oxidoreductase subunit NqrF